MARRKRSTILRESQAATAVSEAVALSLEEIGEKIRAQLNPPANSMAPGYAEMPYCWVRATYDDRVIVEKAGKLWEISYTVDGSEVTLGEPAEVAVTYTRIAESGALTVTYERVPGPPATVAIVEAGGLILEAKSKTGNAWDVLLIKAGTSGNRRHYPAPMLEAAVPLFESVKAYADHPTKDEQRSRPERSVRDVVGWFEGVRWDADEQGIRGTFKILESADWLRSALKSAWDQGKRDLLGFSINATGKLGAKRADGSTLIESLDSVASTDVVTTPGAGGRLLGVLESERNAASGPEGEMDPEEIKRLIQEALSASTAGLLEAMRTEVSTAVAAAVPAPAATAAAATEPPAETITEAQPDPVSDELKAIRESFAAMQRESRKVAIRETIRQAKLPEKAAAKLALRLCEAVDRREVEDSEVESGIADLREMIAESGPARPSWQAAIATGDDRHDKMRKALEGWFHGSPIDGVPMVRDFRESYAMWTGQNYLDVDLNEMFASFSGRYDSGRDHGRILESLSTSSWADIFADVFYLRMMKEYRESPDYDKWRMLVSDMESVTDFRTHHITRLGGYGDFATVAELATYPTLTSPGDEEIELSVQKRGGIDDFSMEMILGDRLNVVRRLPRLMGYAAARTLYKFVFNLATTDNPTLPYDSVALYDAAHANTGTTALSVAGLDAVKVAMRSQTAFGQSQEILGTRNAPKILIVPNEMESRAKRIIDPSDAYAAALASSIDTNTELDPHMFKGSGIQVHVYDQLTDATDWWVAADPNLVPTIVMGFLNGRTEPELFIQDQANVGSVFTADKHSIKLRHVYGGAVQEHRSFYRQVVTGS